MVQIVSTVSVLCVLGDNCGLKWSGEASSKKLNPIYFFRDGLDLNGLWVWEEAALSERKNDQKEAKRNIKHFRPHGQLSPIYACSWSLLMGPGEQLGSLPPVLGTTPAALLLSHTLKVSSSYV